jgi:oligopeptide/dipeptide ABC transporter ATP-binding protein
VAELLTVRELRTYFYTSGEVVRAVEGVSFSIGRGETMGLVGETGCGKSVTALSLLRLIHYPPGRIVHGNIYFEGRDLLTLTEKEMRESIRGKKVAMIFQEPRSSFNPAFRIGQQMVQVIRAHEKVTKKKALERAKEMIEQVKMADGTRILNYYPHELSGGMLQRAMIAMELTCNPLLFIADEPTTALDVTIQAQIMNLLRRLQRDRGMAILLISHDLGVIAQLCQNVAVMYAGCIVEYGPVDRIFLNPIHPYTRGLLKAVVGLGKEREKLDVIPGDVPDLTQPPPGCRFQPRCRDAVGRCRVEMPRRVEIEPRHFVYCYL